MPAPLLPDDRAMRAVLAAFAHDVRLFEGYALKGGSALQRVYQTPRASADLDFSSRERLASPGAPLSPADAQALLDAFVQQLNAALDAVKAAYGFRILHVQSAHVLPSGQAGRSERSHPAFVVKVGYASRPATLPLSAKVTLDISLYETVCGVTVEDVGGVPVQVSALNDIVAEKLRALLQQVTRNRNRPGDVYDLWFLITKARPLLSTEKVGAFLAIKCAGHEHLDPVTRAHFNHPEIRERAHRGYGEIQRRLIGKATLPPFDTAFAAVLTFVDTLGLSDGLPWTYERPSSMPPDQETDGSRSSSTPTG